MSANANRNTWWFTRPKRSLAPVPNALLTLANAAEGRPWKTSEHEIELEYENQLELAGIKRIGRRYDQGGGGARTYRAWLKSLGLLWMDEEDRLQLTLAGEAIVEGRGNLLALLIRQVLHHQFPSAFTSRGASSVNQRFKVRPFVLLLQLLLDDRLGGYLDEREDVAKIVLCYGETNSDACVDDLVSRILNHRADGDSSLPDNYLEQFASQRSQERTLPKLFNNLSDIANTGGNWLAHTQLITRTQGRWGLATGARDEAEQIVDELVQKPLIGDPEDQEKFQRRYGLTPDRRKDTRSLTGARSITGRAIQQRNIMTAYTAYASSHLVTRIDGDLITEISQATGIPENAVAKTLNQQVSTGVSGFLLHYTTLADGSRKHAREFETATAEIFQKIFGFRAEHIGRTPKRPDVVLYSDEAQYAAILDTKAYGASYSLGADHRGRMREYVEDFNQYRTSQHPLAFFGYVVSRVGPNMDSQLAEVHQRSGTPGSAVSARDIVLLVNQHLERPISHSAIREMLSQDKALELAGAEHSLEGLAARSL